MSTLSGYGEHPESSHAPATLSHLEWKELAEYLGSAFHPEYCVDTSWRLAEEFRQYDNEAEFYEHSQMYLYDLANFATSKLKETFRGLVRVVAPRGALLLDYGCGTGSDGIRFIEQGYQVSFADLTSPSTDYLLWRLSRRNYVARFFDVQKDLIPPHDVAYAFDVLEHVNDPVAILNKLTTIAQVIVVNFVTTPDYALATFPMHHNHDWESILGRIRQEHHLICAFKVAPGSWYQLVAFRQANAPPFSLWREYLAGVIAWAPLRIRAWLLRAIP